MSKDPAVLFYTADFFVGTVTMSDEQVGKYIRLLCLQHQHGRLSEQDMLSVCKTYDARVFEKFKVDENGLYFNARMEEETNRRNAYVESRKRNRSSPKKDKESTYEKDMSNTCNSYVRHMENENINESDIDNKKEGAGRKPFVKPTLEEVTQYCQERNRGVNPDKWLSYYEANGWKVGKNPMKDWKAAVRTWEPEKPKQPETKQSAPIDWSTA